MAIVPKGIRPFVKRTSIPAAKAAAQKWLASVTTATNAPEHRKSALRARLDYGRSLSRTTPTKEALTGFGNYSLPPTEETGTAGSSETGILSTIQGADQGGAGVSSADFLMVMNRLSDTLLNEPIQTVFESNALVTLRDSSQTEGLQQTSQLVDAALQGQPVITRSVKSTIESELGQVGQQPPQQTAVPEATTNGGMGEMGGLGESQVVSALRRKFLEAKQNPFVKMDKNELAQLYDMEAIKGVR